MPGSEERTRVTLTALELFGWGLFGLGSGGGRALQGGGSSSSDDDDEELEAA